MIRDAEKKLLKEIQLYYRCWRDEDGIPTCHTSFVYYTKDADGWWKAHQSGLRISKFREGDFTRFDPSLYYRVPETLPLRALSIRLEETGKWIREVESLFSAARQKKKS